MNLRPLGRSGLQVSPLCFGCNVFGWTIDEATSFSFVDAWLDADFNFIDTADVYSIWAPGHTGGESETIIGKWRVVALSGGYSRDAATARLARNHGVIASFSRALTEGLSAQQDKQAFNAALDA